MKKSCRMNAVLPWSSMIDPAVTLLIMPLATFLTLMFNRSEEEDSAFFIRCDYLDICKKRERVDVREREKGVGHADDRVAAPRVTGGDMKVIGDRVSVRVNGTAPANSRI
jgi:hypothetical protein